MARRTFLAVAALALVAALCGPAQADTLADVKARGVLVAGVRDTLPPFGTQDAETNRFEGYDIDIVRHIADKLGVKVVFKRVTAVNRIPMLMEGKVDILAAAMTKTPERAQQIDFSHTYFLTGQKFLARKGKIRALKDLERQKIATARGTTAEKNMAETAPLAMIVSYDDYPTGIQALKQGKVLAVTTDEAILAGQLCLLERNPSTRGKFEIPDLRISTEPYALGVRKNDDNFRKFVNDTLVGMEGDGEAKKIFARWFGPKTECPINRGEFSVSEDALMAMK